MKERDPVTTFFLYWLTVLVAGVALLAAAAFIGYHPGTWGWLVFVGAVVWTCAAVAVGFYVGKRS